MSRRGVAGRSIAVQVWGMVLVACALLAALIVLNTRADQARELELVSRELDRRLETTRALLAAEVEEGNDTEMTLTEVAEQPDISEGGAACTAALSGLQRAIEAGYLEVVDSSGAVVCTPRDDHRGIRAPWAGSELLTHVAARRAATDAPVRDPYTGELVLYTIVPLATAKPSSLVYAVATQTALLPDSDDGSVEWLAVDARSGTVLMAVPERPGVVGSALADRSLLTAADTPRVRTASGSGGSRLYRGARLADSDVVLLVSADESSAYASARSNLRRNLVFGAALILVLLAVGSVLQRRVVRPVRRLRASIEGAGRGAAPVAPTDGPSELAALGGAFNEMLALRRQYELELAHDASHDALTGLPNRRQVTERLAARIAAGDPCAAVFVDLDRFKLVNDAHGHGTGDEVLVAVGRHLVEASRPGEVVGRFGGDEFVVVVGGVSEAGALEVADRLARALARPVQVGGGRELIVSGSVGIALHAAGEDADAVLHHADTAMYQAKAHGSARAAVFDAAMREVSAALLRTETDLHRALEREELLLHLQPVVDLADGTVLGAEALVRWQHPERGLVPPLDFIGVAEQTGLIVPIGSWVLLQSCHWAATTSEQLGRPLSVAVNVSAHQLSQQGFADVVSAALLETGLAPEQLTLEITESALVHDREHAIATLGVLRSRGLRIAIDDFGTGWSSLTYLQTLPVDEIKLDRSYVSRLPDEPTASAIVTSLLGMAQALGLSVTAEGVESPEQLRFLRSWGCEKAQGYLFQRPVDAATVLPVLQRSDWSTQGLAAD